MIRVKGMRRFLGGTCLGGDIKMFALTTLITSLRRSFMLVVLVKIKRCMS